jgi:hypothetical protein
MRLGSKGFLLLFLVLLLSVPILVCLPFGRAQSGTNVSGIISQDTTWTISGSPYTLTGNTLVYQAVTLTIQPGVIVNLGSYYIEVNGTLSATGNSNEKITFNGGQIIFTTASNGWNEQTNSGCTIEYSVIDQTSISSTNPIKIDNCIINSQITVASSVILNNIVTGNISSQSAIPAVDESNPPVDTSVISGNNVNGNIVIGAVTMGALTAPYEACSVFSNTVDGSIISGSPQGTPQIFNNTVSVGGIGCDGYGSIFNNCIYGCKEGISLYTERVFGGNLPCYATVENNLVIDNSEGISIDLTEVFGGGSFTPTILNNTISWNQIGISLSELGYNKTPTIQNNNLQNNSNYNFYLQAPNNVDATYNWWGTTNQQAINQTIYDFKNDFNLGTVSFVPFLTEPNPQAPSQNTPLPTPNPTTSSSPTPPVPEFPALAIVLPLLLSMLLIAVVLRHRKTSNLKQ